VTYTLTVDQKPAYLHAVVTGENSAQTVEQYMEELMRECTARGASRVLIEERLVGPRLGPFEVFSMVSRGTARYSRAVEALAFVDVNAEGNVMRFAEEVAVNRGFPVRMFPTVAAAEQWLLHGQHGGAGS
jgi:hypothetical protein